MPSAIYARVSTSDQRPEIQTERLRQYAAARGFEVTGEYVDHGVSGAKASRPALDRLMAAARRRGKRIGRPEACDRRERERIVRLSKVGRKSLREIGAMVGVSKSTVGRVLAQAASASPGQ